MAIWCWATTYQLRSDAGGKPRRSATSSNDLCLYLDLGGLIPVLREIERHGWTMKSWTTREGEPAGGARFTKTTLYNLLTNIIYTGRVKYGDEIYQVSMNGSSTMRIGTASRSTLTGTAGEVDRICGIGAGRCSGDWFVALAVNVR